MKVIYSHDIFTEQSYGGVSRYFAEIISQISSLNLDPHIIAGFYFNEYLSDLDSDNKVSGIKVSKNLVKGKFGLRLINEVYQRYLIKPDPNIVLHQTYYSPFPINKNIKVVTTVHDMVHELFPNLFSKRNLTSYAKRKSCDRADKIIAVSKSTKKDLIEIFNIDPQKIEVIYHGTRFSSQFKDIEPYQHHSPYILFVGARRIYKNFDRLLEVFARSNQLSKNFNLVCFGGGAFTKEEQSKIAEYKLASTVCHRSGPDLLLARYYAGARALVYPSLYEGFGIPLLEAMSVNCPVICSDQSSIPEVATDAGIYINPHDSDAIQSVLEHALFNDTLLKEAAIKGFERHQAFTWEIAAKKTKDVYTSLLA